ncbi:MAG: DNA polymerase IV [Chloroflexi bacterium]|nr:DNA polymerase IV [Chloroflexota bacterium]MQC26724.1 DNA polymerase IV [Chloroflexota bacterium]
MSELSEDVEEFRKIVHLDLDAFFCAVEELHDPSLREKPFAVGGSPEHRGVVASCSYAARKYGVHSAMSMAKAKQLCPDLINVRHSFGNYTEYSRQVMDILRTYSPLVQPISIDEAFMDLSHLPDSTEKMARQIQAQIHHEVQLPSSLGVASNKLVAKIATNVGKAAHGGDSYPNAVMVVPPGEEAVFLAPLPSDALWGVGPKTAEKLAELGLHTIGDIAAYSFEALEQRFGQTGRYLHQRARGADSSPVRVSHDTKSVSHEVTYSQDTYDENKLRETIGRQAQSISKRLRKLQLYGSTVKLKLRWPDFTTFTRQSTLNEPTDQADDIERMALELLRKHWKRGRKVRLLGVGVSGLGPPSKQLNLWDWDPADFARTEKLETTLEQLKTRYGAKAVQRASKLERA